MHKYDFISIHKTIAYKLNYFCRIYILEFGTVTRRLHGVLVHIEMILSNVHTCDDICGDERSIASTLINRTA